MPKLSPEKPHITQKTNKFVKVRYTIWLDPAIQPNKLKRVNPDLTIGFRNKRPVLLRVTDPINSLDPTIPSIISRFWLELDDIYNDSGNIDPGLALDFLAKDDTRSSRWMARELLNELTGRPKAPHS